MKFSLFVHMERLNIGQTHQELYAEFIALCEIADQGGMHAIWTGEHHGMDFTIAPNPFINLADLARRTRNVRLGVGTVIAPFWHPIKLAGEAAMTDIITGGRLELGIARGAYSFEYERLLPGLDAWSAGQRLREMVPAIQHLWAGDYAHTGEYWQFPATTSAPKPLQHPHPPLWIAARDPNSHLFAVQSGCNVQCTPLANGEAEIASLMQRFTDACIQSPDIPLPRSMLLLHTYVGEDQADLEQAARELSRYYHYFFAWFKNERPLKQGLIAPLNDNELAANSNLTPQKMIKNLPIGTSQQVIERLKTYQAQGWDEYSLWIDSGMSFARKKASLLRFINEVMPAFG